MIPMRLQLQLVNKATFLATHLITGFPSQGLHPTRSLEHTQGNLSLSEMPLQHLLEHCVRKPKPSYIQNLVSPLKPQLWQECDE